MKLQINELIDTIDKIISLLESDNNKNWIKWAQDSRRKILNSDISGIEQFLKGYGGMGSFNDLVICQVFKDGSLIKTDDFKEKNDLFSQLRSEAWELALHIKRNYK